MALPRLQRELFFQPLLEDLGYPFAPKTEPVLGARRIRFRCLVR